MLRTNLSTRPFYNERAVRTGLIALAVVALGLTVFNAIEILRLERGPVAPAAVILRAEMRQHVALVVGIYARLVWVVGRLPFYLGRPRRRKSWTAAAVVAAPRHPELPAGPDDAEGDFAAVRDKDF